LAEKLRNAELLAFSVYRNSVLIEPIGEIWKSTEQVAQILFEKKEREDRGAELIKTCLFTK